MKAMILAAGKGTRVRPITYTVPKPMIPLLRKPLMDSIIEHLASHSIREIVVNTSYLSTEIEDYFRDGQRYGVELAYSFEGRLKDGQLEGQALGSAGGMKKIQDFSGFFDETFIVVCGDAWIDLDIDKVYQFHKARGAIASIVLKEVPHDEVYKYGVVATDEDGRIRQFQEKPTPEEAVSNTINTGIYLFEPEIFEHIPAGTDYDIGGELFPDIAAKGLPFYGVNVPFQWVDIGSLPDIWTATRQALRGEIQGYPLPGKEIAPGVRVGVNVRLNLDKVDIEGPVYIGSSTYVGDGAVIKGPCQIGTNCRIDEGAELIECIIDDYTHIAGSATLRERILYGQHCITPDGEVMDISAMGIDWILNDARADMEGSLAHKMMFDWDPQKDSNR